MELTETAKKSIKIFDMPWKEQMQKYKEYAEELKQMRNNLNKNDERYKKALEVFKNGNNN